MGRQQQQDDGATECYMDCDKGSYIVMKYDTTKCIFTYLQGCTNTYVRKHILTLSVIYLENIEQNCIHI